jgi:glycosyltransferase involved in cell wall biosynthesis
MSNHNPITNAAAQPAASVLLPVFNAARYVEEAIRSILEQSFTNFELLLLDDGSSDDSLAVLQDFAQRDTRCIVHTRENRGLVQTLNEGIALSRADILFRMDADDRSHRLRFEREMAYLREHPDCVAVGTDVMLIDPEGQPLRPFGLPCSHADIDAEHMQGVGSMIVHPTAALRKAALVSVGGYRDAFKHAEDFDLFLRLAEIGQIVNLPDVLLDYRQHLSSIGYSQTSGQLAAKQRALTEARLRRGIVTSGRLPNPDPPPLRAAAVHRMWAWWALSAGNIATARKHTLLAARLAPFAIENLRLTACVLRGY